MLQEAPKKEENQPSQPTNQPNNQLPANQTTRISFRWVILGIGAVLLMWMLSHWIFKG